MGYMNYGEDKKKEHTALIRSAIVRYPAITAPQIVKILAERKPNPVIIGDGYVRAIMKKIHRERASRYDRATKQRVLAEFDDFISDLEPLLRNIGNNSKSDIARIMALKQLVENKKNLIDKMMDFGILERSLGDINLKVIDVAKLAQIARDELKKHNGQPVIENRQPDNNTGNG